MTDKNLVIEREIHGNGTQRLYRFDNDFGASVVRHCFSYGSENANWELAVIQYTGDGMFNWNITYDTPITDNVEGNLTDSDVDILLQQIKNLPRS